MDNNASPPFLGQQLPTYPPLLQLLRVMGPTVPGPSGGTSVGLGTGNVPPSVLYLAATQQLRTDTLAPRDREPCLVTDTNSVGLTAGYYLGRLAGSYNPAVPAAPSWLPVYEVATLGTAGLPGLTPAQVNMLNSSLTPLQVADLNNLTACQLQVLMQLPVVNIQLLSNLNPTQVQNVVDGLTFTQLKQTATQISVAQVTVLSSAYPVTYQAVNQLLTPQQSLFILTNLTSQQFSTLTSLTSDQLRVVSQLTTTQLQTLTNLTLAQVTALVGQLTVIKLSGLLTTLTTSQLQQLTNNLTSSQIQQLLVTLTAAQVASLTVLQLLTLVNIPPAQVQIVGQLTTAQIQDLTNRFTSSQIQDIVRTLDVVRAGTVLTGLSTNQTNNLTRYASDTAVALVDKLTLSNLVAFLSISTPPPSPILGSQDYFPVIPEITSQPSSVPGMVPPGFAPIVADFSGKVWVYIGGMWGSVGGGGGGGGTSAGAAGDTQLSDGSGGFTTPAASALNWVVATATYDITGEVAIHVGTGRSGLSLEDSAAFAPSNVTVDLLNNSTGEGVLVTDGNSSGYAGLVKTGQYMGIFSDGTDTAEFFRAGSGFVLDLCALTNTAAMRAGIYYTPGGQGITHTIPLGPLTPTGTPGSVTYDGGIPIAYVDPT